MESHVSDTWQAMGGQAMCPLACPYKTHGKPCVPLHGRFKMYKWDVRRSRGGEDRKEEGKEKGRKGKEKWRKEEKKKEENRRKMRKKEKEERKKKECCVVTRPGRQRTRNCATRGRFPPTPVILCLGATNGLTISLHFRANLKCL